jgi:hypothetical protein
MYQSSDVSGDVVCQFLKCPYSYVQTPKYDSYVIRLKYKILSGIVLLFFYSYVSLFDLLCPVLLRRRQEYQLPLV